MSSKVVSIDKGSRPSRLIKAVVDQIIITPGIVKDWQTPPFQRPLNVNAKVRALSRQLPADHGVLPGTIILGKVNNVTYLVDGQQRREAFLLSGCKDGACHVATYHCDTMGELGQIFVRENSHLVSMRPDDILRGLEGVLPVLNKIRTKCPFVGYGKIKRSETSPMLSMSTALRAWFGSSPEIPTGAGMNAAAMAEGLREPDAESLIEVLTACYESWGLDQAYSRLWNNLNLIITVWLYRRTVLISYAPQTTRLDRSMFKKCLMELSADRQYLDWLHRRMLHARELAPCYGRMKTIFARRIYSELQIRAKLPAPAWAHGMAIYSGRSKKNIMPSIDQ